MRTRDRTSPARALAGLLLLPAPALGQPWTDAKAGLVAHGVTPAILYDGDVVSNLSGGGRRGSVYAGALHLQATIDGDTVAGLRGTSVFLNVLDTHGGQPSALAGDAQGVSNIAAPPALTLYEAWIQYNAPGDRYSVLAGRYDLNSEFYRLTSAGLFLNSSFGVGPEFAQSGSGGPSIYPDTSLGARLSFKPTPNIVVRAAILDGRPLDQPSAPIASAHGDGLLLVSELAILNRPGPEMPPGSSRSLIGRNSTLSPYEDKFAIGGWYYTASFDDLSETGPAGVPLRHRGSGGAYLLVDERLYGSPGAPELSGFLEAGAGDDRVNRFGTYVGFGIAGHGLVPGRPDDELGLAAAIGRNGSHFTVAQNLMGLRSSAAETSVELTYLFQAADWIAVQPDLQYVIDPNTDPRRANATVFQIEAEVSL